jgi:hypothetical protein
MAAQLTPAPADEIDVAGAYDGRLAARHDAMSLAFVIVGKTTDSPVELPARTKLIGALNGSEHPP